MKAHDPSVAKSIEPQCQSLTYLVISWILVVCSHDVSPAISDKNKKSFRHWSGQERSRMVNILILDVASTCGTHLAPQ